MIYRNRQIVFRKIFCRFRFVFCIFCFLLAFLLLCFRIFFRHFLIQNITVIFFTVYKIYPEILIDRLILPAFVSIDI